MYSRFLFNAEIIKQFHMAHHFHMTSAQAIVLHKALTGCCFPVIIWFTTPSKYNQYHTLLLSQLFAPTFQLSRKLSIVIYTVIPCYTYNKAQLKTWGLHNSRFFFHTCIAPHSALQRIATPARHGLRDRRDWRFQKSS